MAEGGGRDRAAYERDGELVLAARAGDDAAFTQLFNGWFDPVFDAARRIVNDTDIAAEVAQDTFLSVWQHLADLREPSTFGAFALRTARNKALNRSAKERRSVAVDDTELVPVLDGGQPFTDGSEVLTQREGDALVWAASAALGEREASILDLHLRHGLTAPELADELGVTPNNAHQLLFRMKKKLGTAIEAWVLWKGGSPSCEDLVRDLDRAGVHRFSADAVRVINKHVEQCRECGDRKLAALAPEALFASVPIAVVAPALRDRVAASLQAQGVPVQAANASSTSSTTSTTPPPGPPAAPPLGGPEFDIASGSSPVKRRLLLAGVAALVLLLLLAGGFALSRGSSTQLIDAAAPPSTTVATTGAGKTLPTSPAGTTPGTDVDTTTADPEATEPPADTTPDATGDPRNGSTTTTAAPNNVVNPGNGGSPAPQIITVPPSIVPVPPSNPTTTASTSPPPPPPPPPAPTIPNFSHTTSNGALPCGSVDRRVTFSWTTTNATYVRITLGYNSPAGNLAANGNVTICVPMAQGPQTYRLTAYGAGGTATDIEPVS